MGVENCNCLFCITKHEHKNKRAMTLLVTNEGNIKPCKISALLALFNFWDHERRHIRWMQLQGQNGFGYESLVWHRREKLQDKAKSLGRAENMRPRRPVFLTAQMLPGRGHLWWTLLEKFPTPSGNGWNSWREIQIKTSQSQWEQKCALITLWEHSEMLEWHILPYQICC